MEEISISVAETNALRAKVGLPPIPDPADVQKQKNSRQSLTIEETNKVRESLGLKPIEVTNASKKSSDTQIKNNQNDKEQKLKEKLESAKQRAVNRKKTQFGKTLLDSYEEQSTDDWLTGLGQKKAKNTSISRSKGSKSTDSLVDNEADLIVSHKLGDLKDVDNGIFTLEDNDILDEDDAISNDKLSARAKVEKDLKEKAKVKEIRGGLGYKPLEDEDDIEEAVVVRGGTIDISHAGEKAEDTAHEESTKRKIDIDLFEEEQRKPKKVKMKKLKKKADKKQRVKVQDDDIKFESVELSAVENELEDDLEATLALQRKLKQQKRRGMKPEDIAKEIRQTAVANETNELERKVMMGIELQDTFDPTNDFLKTLKPRAVNGPVEEPVLENKPETQAQVKPETAKPDALEVSEGEESSSQISHESEPISVKPSLGLSEALKRLRSKELLPTADTKISKDHRAHLQELELTRIKMAVEERKLRETLQTSSEYNAMPKEEQEAVFRNKLDEVFIEKGIVTTKPQPRFTPKVHIEHRNDAGEEIDTKQAYKLLSSKFHGTKSKQKKKWN